MIIKLINFIYLARRETLLPSKPLMDQDRPGEGLRPWVLDQNDALVEQSRGRLRSPGGSVPGKKK